jgi:hypothetical protein
MRLLLIVSAEGAFQIVQQFDGPIYEVRRQSEAATALWPKMECGRADYVF